MRHPYWILLLGLVTAVTSPGRAVEQSAQALTITARSRAVQPGEVVLLAVTAPAGVTTLEARAFDRDLLPWRGDDGVWHVMVGIDLNATVGTHPVAVVGGPGIARGRHDLIVAAKDFPTRSLTVAPAFVNPPAGVQDRIVREAEALNKIWASTTAGVYWTDPFVRPVPHESNSAFGSRSVFNGQARSPHGGADFLSPAGTVVAAPNAGRVVLAGDLYYTGGTVVIDHGRGLISLLAHLSTVDAVEGALVEAGEPVGQVGATGRVTGAHLHWTVRLGGARVDPLSLLTVLGGDGR